MRVRNETVPFGLVVAAVACAVAALSLDAVVLQVVFLTRSIGYLVAEHTRIGVGVLTLLAAVSGVALVVAALVVGEWLADERHSKSARGR